VLIIQQLESRQGVIGIRAVRFLQSIKAKAPCFAPSLYNILDNAIS
jgi:hypothetical protein